MMTNDLMIEAHGLTKRFGSMMALDGVDLEVPAGSILAVLGPNGAGKTTAVRILTTLMAPDGGSGRVAGYDIVKEAAAVRAAIGVTAQDATVDELMTGRQNLLMIGRLSGLRRADARRVADALLEQFELSDAATRLEGSRPVVGSSRNSTGGRVTRPAARSRRRRIPPE
jgi:ABC-type multidrug transport system ATPase subunit